MKCYQEVLLVLLTMEAVVGSQRKSSKGKKTFNYLTDAIIIMPVHIGPM